MKMKTMKTIMQSNLKALKILGGFQLLDLIITKLKKSHDLLKIQGLSFMEILFCQKKILYEIFSPVQSLQF